MLNRFKVWWRRYFPAISDSPNVLSNYRRWRQQFFYQRLRLLIWLFLFVLITLNLFRLFLWITSFTDVRPVFFLIDGLIGLILGLGLFLHSTQWGKRYPSIIFLGISGGVTLTLLITGVLQENLDPADVALWTMVFLSQSALIPVRWQVHVRSQLVLLIPFTLLMMFQIVTIGDAAARSNIILSVMFTYIYLLWTFVIGDLAVYLYERLRYQEFEARQEVKTFLHAVSHDLRNPVTGTQLLIKSLLEQHGKKILLPRSLLEQMLQSGERQLVLINSLLEAHNNNLKGMILQRDDICLYSLVQSICQELSPQLNEANITLYNQISPNLSLVYGDCNQLWRVFQNLIVNALHHNPPGISIWLNASVMLSPQPHVFCTVKDNGVGMTAEQCAQLFTLYSQGHRRRHLSVGLGLHIAQQIIDAHGGKINVSSSMGQGSIFELMLPLASVHPAFSQR